MTVSEQARQRAAAVRLLCLDVDGTLTDGKLYIHGGVIGRAFNVLDGLGVQRLIEAGNTVAIITALREEEGGIDLRVRARQMGVRHVYTDVRDKRALLRQLLAAEGLSAEQAGFVGDDLPDLEAMQSVGFAAAPPTAAEPVLACVHYTTARPAGGGAVREICDFILSAQARQ